MSISRGLGRGIESLIPASVKPAPALGSQVLPISSLKPNPHQPRQRFDEEKLKELADSIRQQGMIQPILVAPVNVDAGLPGTSQEYEIVAGERRWRAAKLAGLLEVPVVFKKVTGKEKLQLALIENLQREDLNPMEEAQAYQRIMSEHNLTQEELAGIIGKGRVVVANTLRLLRLPQALQDAVFRGDISQGHARSLITINDELLQREMAEKILRKKFSVRETEKMVSDWKEAIGSGRVKLKPKKDPEVREIEEGLQKSLGTKVEIQTRGKDKKSRGWIKIAYFSLDDLNRLLDLIGKK